MCTFGWKQTNKIGTEIRTKTMKNKCLKGGKTVCFLQLTQSAELAKGEIRGKKEKQYKQRWNWEKGKFVVKGMLAHAADSFDPVHQCLQYRWPTRISNIFTECKNEDTKTQTNKNEEK